MKKHSIKTVILTSRENFSWLSMQEIVPMIERSWLSSKVTNRHEVICKNVDDLSFPELLPDLLSADNIVFACFTVRLCRIGEMLRKNFDLDARYFIYLHNQATIACWPLHKWGMGNYLRESDIFISTCTKDIEAFRHSFSNARVELIPFTLKGLKSAYQTPPKREAEVTFTYVGRLSEQKNIHTLLSAFAIFKQENPSLNWRLHIFGKDDNLGSPNMGISSKGYSRSLLGLTSELGLQEKVLFEGYQKRQDISRFLSNRLHIAVSASVHSDENFGMAQFRSLTRGNFAVLTRWGGYADFGKHFSKNVFLVPVEESSRGPFVDASKFANQLELATKALQNSQNHFKASKFMVPRYYWEETISNRLLSLATAGAHSLRPLTMTSFAKKVLKKKASYKHNCQIFDSYSDPNAKILLRSYGMSAT